MASPFPGMDPYLERHWGDIHARLIIYACDRLQKALPKDLRARVEERVFVESPELDSRQFVPDVRVYEGRRRKAKPAAAAKGLALAEPLIVISDDEVTQGFIEIRDASAGHRVVTVIEILSPSNKVAGEGRDKYLQKRKELQKSQTSLVEIDLVREGQRPLPVPLERLPPAYRTAYQVWVRRAWDSMSFAVYAVPLRERLPRIKIPLRQTDADVPLDLQALVDQCYENGDYEADIDYRVEPEPPLSKEDARWADALLRKLGCRPHPPGRRNGQQKKP